LIRKFQISLASIQIQTYDSLSRLSLRAWPTPAGSPRASPRARARVSQKEISANPLRFLDSTFRNRGITGRSRRIAVISGMDEARSGREGERRGYMFAFCSLQGCAFMSAQAAGSGGLAVRARHRFVKASSAGISRRTHRCASGLGAVEWTVAEENRAAEAWTPAGACPRAARSADPWAGVTTKTKEAASGILAQARSADPWAEHERLGESELS
jgi:hypothetical protein